MKQTVCSAKINECTEICYILNCSLYYITNMDSCEQFFLLALSS